MRIFESTMAVAVDGGRRVEFLDLRVHSVAIPAGLTKSSLVDLFETLSLNRLAKALTLTVTGPAIEPTATIASLEARWRELDSYLGLVKWATEQPRKPNLGAPSSARCDVLITLPERPQFLSIPELVYTIDSVDCSLPGSRDQLASTQLAPHGKYSLIFTSSSVLDLSGAPSSARSHGCLRVAEAACGAPTATVAACETAME
ncbi:hypothetical protein H9P43_001515 [Blastocladiella emersonii ATCC 22665]|nr:hypothetical protein H9P43_001515 [Blastocladiella emersonii ATCC 22665]